MSVFDNFTKKVTETAKAVGKKSGEIVEVTKLNMNVATEEDKITKAYTDIGRTVYEAFAAGENVPENFKELCEKVVEYKKNIEDMKQKILELKNLKLCPACSAELESETAFCPKCGAKQEIPKTEQPGQE